MADLKPKQPYGPNGYRVELREKRAGKKAERKARLLRIAKRRSFYTQQMKED